LAPKFVALTKQVDDSKDLNVVMAEVNAAENKVTAEKYGITAYPTIKYFYHGIPIDFKGRKHPDGIIGWVRDRAREKINQVNDISELEIIEPAKLAVLLYLPTVNSKLLTYLNALAIIHQHVNFYYTYMDEVQQRYSLEPQPSLIVYRGFDEGRKILSTSDKMTFETFKGFFDSVRHPIIREFSDETSAMLLNEQRPTVFLVTDNPKHPMLKTLEKLSNEYKGKITFSWTNIHEGKAKKLAEYLGLTTKHFNQIRMVKMNKNDIEKYKLEEVSEDSLRLFLKKFEEGKLEKYLKSGTPVQNQKELVKTVVGLDFEEKVLNNDKYVLLKIWAHWCKHSKAMETAYKALAQALSGMDNLVIAEFEGHENEHPALTYNGFPTILFYKKGYKSEPVHYEGKRNVNDFVQMLKKEMGKYWTGPDSVVDEAL